MSANLPRPRDERTDTVAPPGSLLRIWSGSSQLALVISPAGTLPTRFSLRLASETQGDNDSMMVVPGLGRGSCVVGGESIWQRVL